MIKDAKTEILKSGLIEGWEKALDISMGSSKLKGKDVNVGS